MRRRGHDVDRYRHILRTRGITSKVAGRGALDGSGPGTTGWVAERTIVWLSRGAKCGGAWGHAELLKDGA